MSGRRRRDDEWGDGRLDAQDDRRDPWADDGIGDWGADPSDGADRSGAASSGGYGRGGAAAGYGRNASPGGQAYGAPAVPSFQARNDADGYGSGSTQRGTSNGYGAGVYGGDAKGAGYGAGRDSYQGAGYGGNGGYGRSGYGAGGQGNDAGYGAGAGFAGTNGRSAAPGFSPEYTPIDNDDADDDAPAGTPRPYGRLSIYTLHEDKTREFDRLAERAAEGVRASEPDTLVYVIHVVPKAPMQRIIYEIYRDRGAFLSHERQPHIRQFAADRAPCVLATNIIDLRLKYAKVASLGSAPETAAAPQAGWTPRAENAQGNDRYAATAQYSPAQSPAPQYSSGQYPQAQYSQAQYSQAQYSQSQGAATGAAASFTPASDYGTDNSQVPTVGREAFSPSAQYGNSANGAYGAGNAQYGAANSNGYSGAAGYANGGGYSGNGYPGPNGYNGANGYSADNGYSSGGGYQSTNGYSSANDYSNGYSNGNGYSGNNGYSNGAGYSGAAGNGYAASGYGNTAAAMPGASATPQYTPRYRELTSGSHSDESEAGGHQGNGNRYADGGRQSAKPSEWQPQSQDYR